MTRYLVSSATLPFRPNTCKAGLFALPGTARVPGCARGKAAHTDVEQLAEVAQVPGGGSVKASAVKGKEVALKQMQKVAPLPGCPAERRVACALREHRTKLPQPWQPSSAPRKQRHGLMRTRRTALRNLRSIGWISPVLKTTPIANCGEAM